MKIKPKGNVRKTGLGDAIEKIAQPIASVLDATLGTDIKNCGGCKKRKEALNKMVPNVNPFKKA